MRSLPLTIMVAALALGARATAQDAAARDTDAQDAATRLASSEFASFEKGDGILSLTIGLNHAIGYYNPNTSSFEGGNATPGFAFALSYTGFLTPKWGLAGDLAGGFVGTANDDRLFVAPLALRLVRAFPIGAFIIAPSAGAGLAISSLGTYRHADALFKLGSSFLWKASSDMSYGLNIYGNVIPQIMRDYPENTRIGFFMEATLSVAYHL